MAERVRQMMKSSTSKVSLSKGSVNHIGTTPYRFRIGLFISYAENIKSISEACITWERRGKTEATNVVSVVDGKAVFRQQLTMECTLFRKSSGKPSKHESTAQEDLLDFDEKKAKLYIRKGSQQGKAVGKLALNLSDYIKGATSTVFADMKLSDGTNVVTKVEATMIAMDKKKKYGSSRGSSVFSDGASVDESLCGDDEDLKNARRLSEIPESSSIPSTPRNVISPVSSANNTPPNISSTSSFSRRKSGVSLNTPQERLSMEPETPNSTSAPLGETSMLPTKSSDRILKKTKSSKSRARESDAVKESPSLREKLKSKFKTSLKKDKSEKHEKSDIGEYYEASHKLERLDEGLESRRSDPSVQFDLSNSCPPSPQVTPNENPEIKELRKQAETLKKENSKLKKAKKAAMEEIESLTNELKSCEEQLDAIEQKDKPKNSSSDAKISKLQAKIREKDKKIDDLKSQNESLIEEMEEQHVELRTVSKRLEESNRQKIRNEFTKSEKIREEQELLEKIRYEQAQLDKSRVELQRQQDQLRHQEQQRYQQQQLQLQGQLQISSKVNAEDSVEVIALKKRVDDLELALQREPTFMDVVNELKVMKMTVALANMEKEEALFELQNMRQQLRSQQLRQIESEDN